eukprot:gene21933-16388_t
MLDIQRRPDVDACLKNFQDILPPFRMPRSGRIGVSVFIDQEQPRASRQSRINVEFRQLMPAIFHHAARKNF